MHEHIRSTLQDQIGIITLDRPDVRNALSTAMWKALPAVLDGLQKNGARVIILNGAGGVFAAGADLVELNEIHNEKQANDFWTAIEDCLNHVSHFGLPVLAEIEGPCMGGGCLLASACDLRYAAPSASFAIPIAALGIVVDDRSVSRISAIVGDSFARQMLFTAAVVHSAEAKQHGLVDHIFESDGLHDEVLKIAAMISKNDANAVAEIKRSFHRIRHSNHVDAPEHRRLIIRSYLGPELKKRVEHLLQNLQRNNR